MEEKFHCPRIPKNESFLIGQNTGTWITDSYGIRRCSDCGSIHPKDLVHLIKEHMGNNIPLFIETTDKSYKLYITGKTSAIKFYTQHLSLLDAEELVEVDLYFKKYSNFLKIKSALNWANYLFGTNMITTPVTHLDTSFTVGIPKNGKINLFKVYLKDKKVIFNDKEYYPKSKEELDEIIEKEHENSSLTNEKVVRGLAMDNKVREARNATSGISPRNQKWVSIEELFKITKEVDMAQDKKLTFGQEVVGLSFNPSGEDKVAKVKQLFADILDLICPRGSRDIDDPEGYSGLQYPFRKLAFDAIVMAQMAVVKYLTWK